MQICIFNPEHDLCLAKGRAHYMPPRSAVDFARRGASLMSLLYPDALCTSLYDLPAINSQPKVNDRSGVNAQLSTLNFQLSTLIPWGWNLVLKQDLLDRGVPETLLPTDPQIAAIRRLQHRATLLPLQPDSQAIYDLRQLSAFNGSFCVLKAPWSGAGRGLRWVSGGLTPHDIAWAEKVIREQECVIVQPRYEVADDFALLYRIEGGTVHFVGYSLFQTSKGVYRGNLLLSDEGIRQRVGLDARKKAQIEHWIEETLLGHYEGPLGVDLFRTVDGDIHVSELNLRHTMGFVAHAFLRLHPEAEGTLFTPDAIRPQGRVGGES